MYKTPNGTKAVDIRGETKTENGIEYRRVQILPAFPQRFEWIRSDRLIPISDAATAEASKLAGFWSTVNKATSETLLADIKYAEEKYAEAKRLHKKRSHLRAVLDDLHAQANAAQLGYILA